MTPSSRGLSQRGHAVQKSSSPEPQMKAPVLDPLCEGPWIGLVCLSSCFHFEQFCWHIKTCRETHLDRLYYPGRLQYPPPGDGNRLGSQKKRKFREILLVCCHCR